MALIYDMETDIRFMKCKKSGKTEGKMLTAEKTLKDGLGISHIRKYTGLSSQQIKSIFEKKPQRD